LGKEHCCKDGSAIYGTGPQRDKEFFICQNVQRVKKNLDTAKSASTPQFEVCIQKTDRQTDTYSYFVWCLFIRTISVSL